MKKLVLSVTALAGLVMAGHAQQVLFYDGNYSNPISNDVTIYGVVDTAEDLNMQLLVGPTAGSVTTDVVTLLLSQTTATATTALGSVQPALGDVSAFGVISDQTRNAYKVPAGTDYYKILVWTGNFSSYAAASSGGQPSTGLPYLGSSGVLQFDGIGPTAGAPVAVEDLPIPINLISSELDAPILPEPSSLTMAGVGIASMLIFRFRK